MTDVMPKITKGGLAKAGFGALYMDICQHITPPLAGYLNMHLTFLGEPLSFEIVVACQAGLGGALIKFTPQHFVQSVTDGILFVKGAFKQWWDAITKPVKE